MIPYRCSNATSPSPHQSTLKPIKKLPCDDRQPTVHEIVLVGSFQSICTGLYSPSTTQGQETVFQKCKTQKMHKFALPTDANGTKLKWAPREFFSHHDYLYWCDSTATSGIWYARGNNTVKLNSAIVEWVNPLSWSDTPLRANSKVSTTSIPVSCYTQENTTTIWGQWRFRRNLTLLLHSNVCPVASIHNGHIRVDYPVTCSFSISVIRA